MKKRSIIKELEQYLSSDKVLNIITSAPNMDYGCWIIRYKGIYVAVSESDDMHFKIYSEKVTFLDVLTAKLYSRFPNLLYKKENIL